MDPAWFVLALSLFMTVIGIAYMRLLAMGMTDRVVADARALVPDAERTIRELRSAQGKAMSTIKTAKKVSDAPPDDDDLMRALNHPMGRGLARGLGIDTDKLLAGDAGELKKLQDVASRSTKSADEFEGVM